MREPSSSFETDIAMEAASGTGDCKRAQRDPDVAPPIVYAIFLALGIGTLLPFNVFVTERAFFEVRSHVEPTWHAAADNIENLIVISFQILNFVGLVALLALPRRPSFRTLIGWPLVGNAAVMAGALAVAAVWGLPGGAVLTVALPGVAATGVTTAMLQAGTLALAAVFPPVHIQAVLAGQAVAGLAVAVASFVTVWGATPEVGSPTPRHVSAAALVYFAIATAVMAGCAGAYAALWSVPYARRHCTAADAGAGDADPSVTDSEAATVAGDHALLLPLGQLHGSSGEGAGDVMPDTCNDGTGGDDAVLRPASLAHNCSERQATQLASRGGTQAVERIGAILQSADPSSESEQWSAWRVAYELRLYLAAVALTFLVTLAVFPGIASSVCSQHSTAAAPPCTPHPPAGRFYGELFVPAVFVLFNAGDMAGRMAAGWGLLGRQPPQGAALVGYAAVRTLLALALALCNVTVAHTWTLPVVFKSDVWPLLFTVVLGLTNGHLASLVCMHAPTLLPHTAQAACGPVLAFSITSGITAGSVLALLLSAVLQRS